MPSMFSAKPFGDEYFDRLAKQLFTLIAKQRFRLRVDKDDFALLVDNDHGVGRGFQQGTELLLGATALGSVTNGAHDEGVFVRLQRAQTNFDGKLGAVLMKAKEREARAHIPRPRLRK